MKKTIITYSRQIVSFLTIGLFLSTPFSAVFAAPSPGSYFPDISADGQYVSFESSSTSLVTGDTNGQIDIFLRDISGRETTRVSVSSLGVQGGSFSNASAISSDGRYVVFRSNATNLVAGDSNSMNDIFLHDTDTGDTTRVSVDSLGVQGNDYSSEPAISSDGRYIVFTSEASNLVAGDLNSMNDIFLHDTDTGDTTRVSVSSLGVEGNGQSGTSSAISSDGRYIAFASSATNLVAGDTNGQGDIFLHDTNTGDTTRVSVDSLGVEGNAQSSDLAISSDGRYIAFWSNATNLVAGDTNGRSDIFLHDTDTGDTTRVSVSSLGVEGNGSTSYPSISSDGRYIAFSSSSTNLVAGDTNGQGDIFLHDTDTGDTTRVSVDSLGVEGNATSEVSSVSSNGRYIAFSSIATNLVAGDTNGGSDIFLHDTQTGETSLVSQASNPVVPTSSGMNYTHPPLCTATLTPSTITKGEQSTLSWNIKWPTDRQSAYYTKIPKNGLYSDRVSSITISPTHTTTYRIATFNLWGANFCESTITVLNEQGEELTSPKNSLLTAGAGNSPFAKAILNFFKSIFSR